MLSILKLNPPVSVAKWLILILNTLLCQYHEFKDRQRAIVTIKHKQDITGCIICQNHSLERNELDLSFFDLDPEKFMSSISP